MDPETAETVVDRGDTLTDEQLAEELEEGKEKKEKVEDESEEDESEDKDESDGKDKDKPKGEGKDKDGKDAKDTRDRRIRVPKWRLDEANAKARAREEALRAENEALKAGLGRQTPKNEPTEIEVIEAKIEELEDKYDGYIADGEKEKAQAVRKEKRLLERRLFDASVSAAAYTAKEQAKQETLYDIAIQEAESLYPELDPDGDAFKPAIAEYVALVRDRVIGEGVGFATALQRALAEAVEAGFLKAPKGRSSAKEETQSSREKAAREAAAKAAGQTPPRTDSVGIDSDKAGGSKTKSVLHLSQDEFAKLSDDQKASMRGDVL